MTGWNTIILLKGEAVLTSREMKNFDKGDTIWGNDSEPKEVNRWRAEDAEEAKKVLQEANKLKQEADKKVERANKQVEDATKQTEFETKRADAAEKQIKNMILRLSSTMDIKSVASVLNVSVDEIEKYI